MYQTMYQRKALKQRAKGLLGWGSPAMYLITLVYILATTWVSSLAGWIVPNPLVQVSNTYLSLYNEMVDIMSAGGTVSQGLMDAFTQQMLSSLTGTTAAIGLLVSLLISFYSFVVAIGYCGINLRTMRGQEHGGFSELFSHFDIAAKIILLEILKLVFVSLWSMLFIVPGIVASYRYRMAEYCLLDDPDISALEAIRRSKKMMFGRKMDLFVTDLSFLGWLILQGVLVNLLYSGMSALTSSTLLLTLVDLIATTICAMFTTTYMSLTEAGFYLFLLGNQAPPVQSDSGADSAPRQFGTPDSSSDNNFGWNQNSDDEGWNR